MLSARLGPQHRGNVQLSSLNHNVYYYKSHDDVWLIYVMWGLFTTSHRSIGRNIWKPHNGGLGSLVQSSGDSLVRICLNADLRDSFPAAFSSFTKPPLVSSLQGVRGPVEGAEAASRRAGGPPFPRLLSWRGRSATRETWPTSSPRTWSRRSRWAPNPAWTAATVSGRENLVHKPPS